MYVGLDASVDSPLMQSKGIRLCMVRQLFGAYNMLNENDLAPRTGQISNVLKAQTM